MSQGENIGNIKQASLDPILWYQNGLSFQARLAGFWASGMGTGLSPVGPGTAGSVLAVGLFYLCLNMGLWVHIGIWVAMLALGYWSTQTCFEGNGIKDDGRVVIDEWLGMWIALLAIPWESIWVLAAFILFRIFDIVKVFPADYFDNKEGSLSVLMDDVVAGIYAQMILRLALEGSRLF